MDSPRVQMSPHTATNWCLETRSPCVDKSLPSRRIGHGACGSVWAIDGSPFAVKRADGSKFRSLSNDFTMHMKALQHIRSGKQTFRPARVPDCYRLISSTDSSWWQENARSFPAGIGNCTSLLSERIKPLPHAARRLLASLYYPPELLEAILSNKENEDCLVRPYLGRRRQSQAMRQSPIKFFTLRNLPLHTDQLEELN